MMHKKQGEAYFYALRLRYMAVRIQAHEASFVNGGFSSVYMAACTM